MPNFSLKSCDLKKKFLRARLKVLDAPKQCTIIEYLEKSKNFFVPLSHPMVTPDQLTLIGYG